jgi:hypothetical protein
MCQTDLLGAWLTDVNGTFDALADGRPILEDRGEGWMSWMSPAHNDLHPVDPLLFELGWRAWQTTLVEEQLFGPDLVALPPDYPQPWTFEPN